MKLFLYLDLFNGLNDRVDDKGVSSFSRSLRGCSNPGLQRILNANGGSGHLWFLSRPL